MVAIAAAAAAAAAQRQQQQQQQQQQEAAAAGQQQQPGGAGLLLQPVTTANFEKAMKRVGPSMARGAAVEFDAIHWDDIGGLEGVKKKLK